MCCPPHPGTTLLFPPRPRRQNCIICLTVDHIWCIRSSPQWHYITHDHTDLLQAHQGHIRKGHSDPMYTQMLPKRVDSTVAVASYQIFACTDRCTSPTKGVDCCNDYDVRLFQCVGCCRETSSSTVQSIIFIWRREAGGLTMDTYPGRRPTTNGA